MGGFVFVIGTRPDMIKMAPLILECQSRDMNIEVIHAGQHYDLNMDQIFVDGLKLPKLTHRLLDTEEVRGKTPSWIFNRIYTRMYAYLYEKRGYWIVSVYGDTWSALACALASQKLGFRVAHIEAGLRSYDLTMPEEGARVQMDAISDVLFPPTKTQAQILKDEGVRGQSYQCGNLIVDALALIRPVEDGFRGYDRFAVMTLHRPENVDNIGRLREALRFVEQTARRDDLHVMWPVHPRAAKQLKNLNFEFPEHIHQSPPVGYATMVSMLRRCTVVFTDSGGLQEEACILGKKCWTLRKNTERPETMELGANVLVDVGGQIFGEHKETWEHPYGSDVAIKIADALYRESIP